jgi:hypothetical protein
LDALIHGFDRSSDEAAALLRLVVDDMPPEQRADRASPQVGVFPNARTTLEILARDSDEVVASLATRALSSLGPQPAPEQPRPLGVLQERPA